MEIKKQKLIEEIKAEHEILKIKKEFEIEALELLIKEDFIKSKREENLRLQEKSKIEEHILEEMKFQELIEKLDFENMQLAKNLHLLEIKKNQNDISKTKTIYIISIILGIVSFIFTILPLFKEFIKLPSIITSISLIILFIVGAWIFNSREKLIFKKAAKDIIKQNYIEARELHSYVTHILDKCINEIKFSETSNLRLDE